jgi:glycosyltransferase involved in cell wall biosynthesis
MLKRAELMHDGRPRSDLDRDSAVPAAPSRPVHKEHGEVRLKVAYLVNQYPKISHSFIRREIHALERMDVEVLRIAARGWDEVLVDAEDVRERRRTRYILQGGVSRLVWPLVKCIGRAPRRFLSALLLALKMSRNADRPLPFHLIYLAQACWMVPILRRARVTHLHAHFGTNPAEVAMLVNALCGVPYSFTVHGIAELDRVEAIGLPEKIRRCAFAVAVSSFGRSQLCRWVEPAHWSKIQIVHCGLEPGFYDVEPIPVPDAARLVCVGRFSEEKGQLTLLAAASLLALEGIEFELVLVGDGEMRAQIEAAIASHHLERHVRITGWLDSIQVRDQILASRSLVLPSFAEGLPVVIMEAMALRRPVLATYVAGIPELVLAGENGWLVPAGAAEELAVAMKACLSTPTDVLRRMGEAGRLRVLARHDVDHEAARIVALIRDQAPRGVEP